VTEGCKNTDPAEQNDLVVVVRWIGGGNALDEFLSKVVGAIRPASTQPQAGLLVGH
jgi:hypothetical protein